jgi:hypothetical protein
MRVNFEGATDLEDAFLAEWPPGAEPSFLAALDPFRNLRLDRRPETQESEPGKSTAVLVFSGLPTISPDTGGPEGPVGEVVVERWRGKESSMVVQGLVVAEGSRATYTYFHDVVTFEYQAEAKRAINGGVANTRFTPGADGIDSIDDPVVHRMRDPVDQKLAVPPDDLVKDVDFEVVPKSGFVSQDRVGEFWAIVEYHTKELQPIGGG